MGSSASKQPPARKIVAVEPWAKGDDARKNWTVVKKEKRNLIPVKSGPIAMHNAHKHASAFGYGGDSHLDAVDVSPSIGLLACAAVLSEHDQQVQNRIAEKWAARNAPVPDSLTDAGATTKRARRRASRVQRRATKLSSKFMDKVRALKAKKTALPKGATVEFATDVEGNLQYLMTIVANSKVLEWDEENNEIDLLKNGYFVHGGDTSDKGPGDIRCLQLLIDLKTRYPERVFLIIGNRDANKLRFVPELAEPYWGTNKVAYLPTHTDFASFLAKHGLERGEVAAVKWMLHETMGSRQTFELRRKELAELGNEDVNDVTDEDVARSFRELATPTAKAPLYLEYLELAQMMAQIGDTLFLHGGLHKEGLGHVPGQDTRSTKLADWMPALNAWADAELDGFKHDPYFREDGTYAGDQLVEYTEPWVAGSAHEGLSTVYSTGFVGVDEKGNPGFQPRYPDTEVVVMLEAAGVRRVCVGHRPQGDTPTVVRDPSGLLIIMADTSFSDMGADKSYNPSNFRGDAYSVVRLTATETVLTGETSKHGGHHVTLPAGKAGKAGKAARKSADAGCDSDSETGLLVGRMLTDESWVKTVLDNGRAYVGGWSGWTCSTRAVKYKHCTPC